MLDEGFYIWILRLSLTFRTQRCNLKAFSHPPTLMHPSWTRTYACDAKFGGGAGGIESLMLCIDTLIQSDIKNALLRNAILGISG